MSEITAVLDTNVLVAGIVFGRDNESKVVEMVEKYQIRLFVNKAVTAEYFNIFSNESIGQHDQEVPITNQHLLRLTELLMYHSNTVNHSSLTGKLTNIPYEGDRRDQKFVIVADEASGANGGSKCNLITRDRDLLMLEYLYANVGIAIVHPKAFIDRFAIS